jgi:mannose-6-phosphate isomerase
MAELYPFLMTPLFDPRPWGTTDLAPVYPNNKFAERIGEAWLTGDNSVVANGPFSGRTLAAITQELGRTLVGEAPRDPERFPLLTKFLFPHEKLSVQVHPDDAAAQERGEPWGKTECWYVAHAKPGAQIALGLQPGVTKQQLAKAIDEKRAEELLRWIDVFTGDMIYVAGGTVHTLGPGSIIVETQQQSDTTYRLYDYGRPRELHLEHGLACVKEQVASGKTFRPAPAQIGTSRNRRSALIEAPYFVVDLFDVKDEIELRTRDNAGKSSAHVMVVTEGCGVVEVDGQEPVTMTKGDAVVIPADLNSFRVRPQWSVEFLKAYVAGVQLPEPKTRM